MVVSVGKGESKSTLGYKLKILLLVFRRSLHESYQGGGRKVEKYKNTLSIKYD